MFASVTTILFDLDGTIVNTNDIILRAMAETLEHATGQAWQTDELLEHWGVRLRDQLLRHCPQIDLELAIPFYRRSYAKWHQALLAEFPGMRTVLDALQARNYALGVVTSKKREIALMTLRDIGYLGYFPVVVVEEDTPHLKPAPDPLHCAIAQFGTPADNAVYVGDNPDDIIAAQRAGMGAIAVSWSLRARDELAATQPHIIIDTQQELLQLFPQRP